MKTIRTHEQSHAHESLPSRRRGLREIGHRAAIIATTTGLVLGLSSCERTDNTPEQAAPTLSAAEAAELLRNGGEAPQDVGIAVEHIAQGEAPINAATRFVRERAEQDPATTEEATERIIENINITGGVARERYNDFWDNQGKDGKTRAPQAGDPVVIAYKEQFVPDSESETGTSRRVLELGDAAIVCYACDVETFEQSAELNLN